MAAGAQVIWTRHGDLAHCAQHRLGAGLLLEGLATAVARDAPLVGRRSGELQQLAPRLRAGVVHGGTRAHLEGLQVETGRFAALLKDHTEQLIYLSRDFLPDRFGRFFLLESSECPRWSAPGRSVH
jgi:hypothetical protein